jgi:hypothetical protein
LNSCSNKQQGDKLNNSVVDSLKSENYSLLLENEQLKGQNKELKVKVSNYNERESISNLISGQDFELIKHPKATNEIFILRTGQFHENEIDNNIEQHDWFAIIKSDNKYFLKETEISIKRFNDIGDNENQETGKEIISKIENPIFLISGLSNLSERELKAFEISTPYSEKSLLNEFPDNYLQVFPGQNFSIMLRYSTDWYYFNAYGNAVPDNHEYSLIQNYVLELIHRSRPTKRQIIANARVFDDEFFDILWLGDIDGDDKLDFLFDSSRHYNANHLQLFLSSFAKEENIVGLVAELISVGC